MNIMIIDNYDSFVFNVVRYCEELGHAVEVVRNDRTDVQTIAALAPDAILISPGPCSPLEAGISLETITALSGRIPLLGICLGHQCIGAAFGAKIGRARVPMHGRVSMLDHGGAGLFAGLPAPLKVGRYHSLVIEPQIAAHVPLRVDAWSPEGEVMAVSHLTDPTFGVQFHPESILSDSGHDLLANFFRMAREWRERQP